MIQPAIVTLDTPIRTLRQNGLAEISEISIRPVIGADVIAAGYPLRIGAEDAAIIPDRMTALIARCGNLTSLAAGSLPIGNWNACMSAVLSFWAELDEQTDPDAIVLRSPLPMPGGAEAAKLTLRQPNGTDLSAVGGYPLRMGKRDSGVEADLMNALIARLAGASADGIASLPIGEWVACMRKVLDFFGVGMSRDSPGSTSSSADGGATSPTS